MYCPKCANPVKDGLKFCNSCGERLGTVEDKGAAEMLDGILETVFWMVAVGFGILVGLTAVMLGKDMRTDLVAIIVVTYLLTLFGVSFTLLRQVPKLIDAKIRSLGIAEKEAPALASAPAQAQLDEYREPAMSVTDRTTKTLEEPPPRRS